MRRDGSSFMWRQPCRRCKYTTSVDIQKMHHKKLFNYAESHVRALSLLMSGEQRYIKAIKNNTRFFDWLFTAVQTWDDQRGEPPLVADSQDILKGAELELLHCAGTQVVEVGGDH